MQRLFVVIYNVAKGFAGPVYNFLIAALAIHRIGKGGWGDYVQILLWINLVVFMANFGNKEYLLRVFSKESGKVNNYFYTHLVSRSPLLLTAFLLLLLIPPELFWLACGLIALTFVYQSLDSLITHYQLFRLQLIAETIGFIFIVGGLYMLSDISTKTLLIFYIIAFLLKLLFLIPSLSLHLIPSSIVIRIKVLKASLPFFLIGLSGWLSSKVDLYVASVHFSASDLAEYQLLITAFIMVEAIAGLIVSPFTKHIYRLPFDQLKKIKYKIGFIGLIIIVPSTIVIWVFLEFLVGLNLSFQYYVLGGVISLPVYFFIVDILEYYRNKNEIKVMYINFLGFAFKILILITLIFTASEIGVMDFLLVLLFSNLIMLIIYKSKIFK